jgi:hypothetical protein
MKRIFSSPVFALAVGLGLRLLFVLEFPANSGDTVLYEQIAANWLKHQAFALDVQGAITPVDLRMPGYPAFLALLYALTGRTGEAARLWVMLAQIIVDLLGCLVIARLAKILACASEHEARSERAYTIALWLAALCPFTANYTAVPLTEVFACLLTGLACCLLLVALRRVNQPIFLLRSSRLPPQLILTRSVEYAALGAGLITGVGALFRPETPLLLIAAAIVFAVLLFRLGEFARWFWVTGAMLLGCLVVLSPWALRNRMTLGEIQFLNPKYSTLPGEIVPYGFMAWERTWLYRVRDCYLVPWKLNDEAINVDDIPARAFDSPEEKQRVAAILEPYNEDLTLTKEEDNAFGQIARERVRRHPLRIFVWIPVARAVVIWFSPRIELLPISGDVFPLAQKYDEDPEDQGFTILLFFLNIVYLGLGAWGAVKLWRSRDRPSPDWHGREARSPKQINAPTGARGPAVRPIVAFLLLFLLLRTAFLTTLETPEPRYVLECFPALIALAAQLFAPRPHSLARTLPDPHSRLFRRYTSHFRRHYFSSAGSG